MSDECVAMAALSPRERELCGLLLEGCRNKEIAQRMRIPLRRVKKIFNKLFRGFGVKGGFQRVRLAVLLYKYQQP